MTNRNDHIRIMNMPLGAAKRTRVARARSLQENVLMPQLELADPYIKMKAVGEAGIIGLYIGYTSECSGKPRW